MPRTPRYGGCSVHGRVARALCCSLACLLASCQYLRNRAIDFTDQFRVVAGAGSVIGVRASELGLVDTGIMVGIKPRAAALGWRYGDPLFFNTRDFRADADQAQLITTSHLTAFANATGTYYSGRRSLALLPALLSWYDVSPQGYEWLVPEEGDEFVDERWLWDPSGMGSNRHAQVHVFDIEAEIALGLYVDVGFSPGELLDFVLGFLTLDLAGDDGR